MYKWQCKKIDLKFKTQWNINGGSAHKKTNDFIVVTKNNFEGWGEISSSTKNNDLEEITKDLASLKLNSLQTIEDIYKLNICPQVLAGIEMAWIHLQCKLQSITIFDLLKIQPVARQATNFSIPILDEKNTSRYIEKFNIKRFSSCKLKIKGLQSITVLKELSKNYNGKIRIDANESFNDANEVLSFINATKGINIEFIEQPLHRGNISEARILKTKSIVPIIGDESLKNQDVNSELADCFHGLNIKLMKSGGYKQAIKQLNQCRNLGLKTMLGCMVETSLNISAALNISANCDWLDLDGHLLLQNDPFSILNEDKGYIFRK